MASPQRENGFTAVANELLDHLIYDTKITAGELKILLFVIRKTYGFQKTKDRISITQFEKGTRFYRANVCRIIKSLVAHKLLLKNGNIYKFNKNWEQWGDKSVDKSNEVVAQLIVGSSPLATKSSSPLATHKRKKETNTKEIVGRGDNLKKIQGMRELLIKKMSV